MKAADATASPLGHRRSDDSWPIAGTSKAISRSSPIRAGTLLATLALSALFACSEPDPATQPLPLDTASSTPAPVAPPAASSPSPIAAQAITAAGYDTIRIGATPAEAGYGLADDGAYQDVCRIYASARLPGLAAMVEDGRIRRITLYTSRSGPSPIRTDRGIGIGSTEAEVRAAYSPLGEELHKYSGPPAKNLYWGEEGVGQALRFEIGEDGKVAELHAGESPWLRYVESCS